MTAVLVDTMSIQEYIYSSNKLRENLGASHIVGHYVYHHLFQVALQKMGLPSSDYDLTSWEKGSGALLDIPCEAAYIGGGNAMIFFKDLAIAKSFIQTFTKLALEYYPGLKLAIAFDEEFDVSINNFKASKTALHKKLLKNRNFHFREINIPKHGINRDCPKTGDAADTPDDEGVAYISHGAKQKMKAAEIAQNQINSDYNDILNKKYSFGSELDSFGQIDGRSYIAVVHIDGNGMGKKFMEVKSLEELRKLSVAVSTASKNCLEKLVKYVVDDMMPKLEKLNEDSNNHSESQEEPQKKKKVFDFAKNGKTTVLPFRPIIGGGDDITFVCEGRLGIHLAEKTIGLLNQATKEALGTDEEFSACAGVAIVKTKYPFFRAYHLAEELITVAKRKAKPEMDDDQNSPCAALLDPSQKDEKPDKKTIPNSSCIDFYISSSGFAGDLETIKESTQTVMLDHATDSQLLDRIQYMTLHYGPYLVEGTGTPNVPTIQDLKTGIKHYQEHWPKNKVMELRDALRGSDSDRSYFLENILARNLQLHKVGLEKWHIPLFEIKEERDKNTGELKQTATTPLYDIIDTMDFYPAPLL